MEDDFLYSFTLNELRLRLQEEHHLTKNVKARPTSRVSRRNALSALLNWRCLYSITVLEENPSDIEKAIQIFLYSFAH